jgi:beta propeller repeat protein/parallel beta-helix repeat protein
MAMTLIVVAFMFCGAVSASSGSNIDNSTDIGNSSTINQSNNTNTINGSSTISNGTNNVSNSTNSSNNSGNSNTTTGGPYTTTEIPINTNLNDQRNPAIYGDKIVWQDNRNGDYDIYMKDLTTGLETVLCNATGDQTHPQIYKNIVVWDDIRYGAYFNIHMMDLTTGIESRISPSTHSQVEPEIYNDIIVWMQWDYADANIYRHNITSGVTSAVCTAPGEQWRPRIYENKVVWFDLRNGNYNIYMKDIVSGIETPICTNSAIESDPRIYGDLVIFRDNRNGNWDIYMYKISSGIETRFTPTPSNQVDSAIYENNVVYTDDVNGNIGLYMKNISTGNITLVCNASGGRGAIRFYNNQIIWDDCRNGNYDIYMGILSNSTNTAPIANAGIDKTVPRNTTVYINGSGSTDPDGDALSYQWNIISKPQGSSALLSNPTSINPTLTPDMVGEYIIQLIVNDGTLSSQADTAIINAINSGPLNWTVNPGESIQERINTASAGDNIIVNDNNGTANTYNENLYISKLIQLIANGNVTINALNPDQSVITIYNEGSGSTINGFTITGATAYLTGGIYLDHTENCTISENNIIEDYSGIGGVYSSNNLIIRNQITGHDYGVNTYYSPNNRFLENNLSNNIVGISIGWSSYNIIQNNTICNNSNGQGIYLNPQASYTIVSGNIINSNRWTGISICDYSDYNQIFDNEISNNGAEGIAIGDGSYNTIKNNLMANNSVYGVMIINGYYSSATTGNNIYNNSFINNPTQAYVGPGVTGNYFNASYPIGGNYWSDYNGIDHNNDGFGDTPYVFNGGQDNLPVAIFHNQSPISNPDGPYIANEGSVIIFDGSASYDPDGDSLIYQWDLDGDGVFESDGRVVNKTWNDDYQGIVTLKVTDTYGESSTSSTNVTVKNVAPIVNISDSYFAKIPITLRIGGQAGNTVDIQIIQDGNVIASEKIIRNDTSASEQEVTFYANIDLSKPYTGRLIFDTGSKLSGATPVWLIIDGKKTRITTFNTKKNDPSSYNQSYDFPLEGLFTVIGKEITFKAEAADPGTDNITFKWDFNNTQEPVSHIYISDGINTVIDTATTTFSNKGIYIITLAVLGDDGTIQTRTERIRII